MLNLELSLLNIYYTGLCIIQYFLSFRYFFSFKYMMLLYRNNHTLNVNGCKCNRPVMPCKPRPWLIHLAILCVSVYVNKIWFVSTFQCKHFTLAMSVSSSSYDYSMSLNLFVWYCLLSVQGPWGSYLSLCVFLTACFLWSQWVV